MIWECRAVEVRMVPTVESIMATALTKKDRPGIPQTARSNVFDVY